MSDDRNFHASDSLLNGRGYTPDYGINQSISQSGNYEASEKVPRPSAIQTALKSQGSERVWVVAMCSLIACLASLVNGMMLGFSSPALTQLQFNVTPESYRISTTDIRYSLFGVCLFLIWTYYYKISKYPAKKYTFDNLLWCENRAKPQVAMKLRWHQALLLQQKWSFGFRCVSDNCALKCCMPVEKIILYFSKHRFCKLWQLFGTTIYYLEQRSFPKGA